MLYHETRYAIAQDYFDAKEVVPRELARIDSTVYEMHAQHTLGLKTALFLLNAEADISLETVTYICNRSAQSNMLIDERPVNCRVALLRLVLQSFCKPSSLAQASKSSCETESQSAEGSFS